MPSTKTSPLRSRGFVLALLCATFLSALASQSAQATTVAITEGSVDWGVRASYRDYIVRQGNGITVSDGAKLCNETTCSGVNGLAATDFIRFPILSGTYDEVTHAVELTLGGAVKFLYTAHNQDVRLSDLRVSMSGDLSVIRADASSVPFANGPPNTWSDAAIVELTPSPSQFQTTGSTTSWSEIPTSLASAGAEIFVGFYSEGDPMDAVSINYTGPGAAFDGSSGSGGPLVSMSPAAVTKSVGSRHETVPVNFESAATGVDPVTVKWQKRHLAEPWADIPGATGPELSFEASAADNGTFYHAVYSDATGKSSTGAAKLTVTVDDVEPPVLNVIAPLDGSTTTQSSATVSYTISDNDTPEPNCTIANGSVVPLAMGSNKITIFCQDDARNLAIKTINVTRLLPPPSAPSVKNARTTTLKYRRGRSAKVTIASVRCVSQTTCLYTITKTIKVKVGKKKYKLRVKGPATLEPGRSGKITTTIPATVVKAIKKARKKVRLSVKVQVSNSLKTRHETTKNAISNVR